MFFLTAKGVVIQIIWVISTLDTRFSSILIDLFRFSYNVPSQVKYSEISEPPQSIHQEHIPPASVIQKAKGNKEYMEICNPPHVVKQPFSDIHMNNQQQVYNDGTVLPQNQYIPKDTQVSWIKNVTLETA